MRILIITDAWHPQRNGVVRVLATLCDRLSQRGHLVETVQPQEFRTFPCPRYPEIDLALWPGNKVAERIRAFDPDAIHIATEGPIGRAGRKYCLRHGLPFTTAYHSKLPEYIHARSKVPLSWLYAGMRRFHAPSSAVLAPSPSVHRELEAKQFRNVHPWAHGVDTDVFSAAGEEPLFADLPRPIHMYVGRVTVDKNLPGFLDLDLPGSKIVVGSGPEKEQLRRQYENPSTVFHRVDDDIALARAYSTADVFVFPSRTDTFGLVMLEALACGVPVAAFPVTGPLDVFHLEGAGETDYGCLNEDLTLAIKRAMTKNPAACRAHAMQFSWDQVVDEFLSLLAPIKGSGGERAA